MTLSQVNITQIRDQLATGGSLNCKIEDWGFLRIERLLPMMCVCKCADPEFYHHISNVLSAEPAIFIDRYPGKRPAPKTNLLIQTVASAVKSRYSAFLLFELVFSDSMANAYFSENLPPPPEFMIQVPSYTFPAKPIQVLEKNLKKISLNRQKAIVKTEYVKNGKEISPYLNYRQRNHDNEFYVKLTISNVFYNSLKEHFFPLVFRKLKKQLSTVLKKTFFEFSQRETSYTAHGYQALGRHATKSLVWQVDQKLAEISGMFDFLYQVTPINTAIAFRRFRASRFVKTPTFLYHPLPVDPMLIKRSLFMVSIDKIDDPTLYTLFLNKQKELDNQLTMLMNLETRKFLYGSVQHFGTVSDSLLESANAILQQIGRHKRRKRKTQQPVDAAEFYQIASDMLAQYKVLFPDYPGVIKIRKDQDGIMVSNGQLLLGENISVPRERLQPLLQHEIGTHIVTYLNGSAQRLKLLQYGLDNYDELQEGLAVMAEFLSGGLNPARLRLLAARVVAGKLLLEGASFCDTFNILHKTHRFTQLQAFHICMRIYRGGGYIKDIIYLRGFEKAINFFKNKDDFNFLYAGKFGFAHVSLVKELILRQIIKPPAILPDYLVRLEDENFKTAFRNTATIMDLVQLQM